MNRLVLATHNEHKAEELQHLLNGTDISVLTLDEFPSIGEIHEDADTLEGNAVKKAREVFRATRLPSLADDTGLEVFHLNGEPGVYSARYAGARATYADNVRKLLAALHDVSANNREARFRSVLAFVAADFEKIVEGICDGKIIEEPRGTLGFGYDPIFLPDGYEQTFAEMTLELKNTLSHRAQAFKKMRSVLVEYFAAR